MNFDEPKTFGPVSLPNSYFEFKRAEIEAMDGVIGEIGKIFNDYGNISGRSYDVFEGYRLDDAEKAIVVAGSTAGTAKVAVDELREIGEKVGLLKIKLFRPFPYEQIAMALKNVKNIAVFDRTMPLGSTAPLHGEIIQILSTIPNKKYTVQSCIYGLGGREIFKEDIKKVFEDLDKDEVEVIKYIGLK